MPIDARTMAIAHFKAEDLLMRASKHRSLPGELLQLNRSLERGHLPLGLAYVKKVCRNASNTHPAMLDSVLERT